MNDLTTSDIAGVSLSTLAFGNDLIALGKAFDLQYIETFGLPSNLLKILKEFNAITNSLNVAMLASNLSVSEISDIVDNNETPTSDQEKKIYQAFSMIIGSDLDDILIPLNCNTRGLYSLADLLDPKKLFPNSFETLTVPVYNTTTLPTNSKTYYPIYVNGGVNPVLNSPSIVSEVGPQIPSGTPIQSDFPEPIVEESSSTILNLAENQFDSRGSAYPANIKEQ